MSSEDHDVRLNDEGTILRITLMRGKTPVDISTSTIRTIRFFRPDSGKIEKSVVLTTDGTDGKLEYVVEAGFLVELGTWKLQGYVEMPAGKWSSSIGTFRVEDVL